MAMTAAKSLVRSYFYQEFLPSQLPTQLLRGGNYLVLLGTSREEERLLASLGVPDHRIFSVENDPAVFQEQMRRNHRGELKVTLYFGELTEFITHYLHRNQRFQVLNLDICGSYLNGIDSQPPKEHRPGIARNPTMMPVLLFAQRNPRTVVATYTPVGRDRPQLREGLKSLAICYWLVPEITEHAVNELFGRYRAAGLSEAVSFNMVLRHLFWIRSHLEHTLLSRVALGKLRPRTAQTFLDKLEWCWDQTTRQVALPLLYGNWLDAVDRLPPFRQQTKSFDLNLQAVTIASYESGGGFYHTGWFTTYQRIMPITAQEWLEQALAALTVSPLRFTNVAAKSLDSYDSGQEAVSDDLIIWSKDDLGHPGRQLKIPSPSSHLFTLGEAPALAAPSSSTPADVIQNGDVKAEIRRLGREGYTTAEVCDIVPEARALPRATVTALIAASRPRR